MSARGRASDRPLMELSPASDSRRGPTGQLWGWSCVDAHAHAIDPSGEHPVLVHLARCGHQVLRWTILQEVPGGRRCPSCVHGTVR